jgi:hypothetical protein
MKTNILTQPVTALDALYNAPDPTDTALIPASVGPVPSTGAASTTSPVCLPFTLIPAPAKRPRNGKIARLPKPVRDVVNRLLFHNKPQEKIVSALDEMGIRVTQQNVSNWKTRGGYREWCLAQEYATRLRLHQDNLVDLLRRHDASELPEVGLQAAATHLSEFFLTSEARQLLASDPKEYERRVSMLARISGQVKALQKYRDDSAKALGYDHNPHRIRSEMQTSLEGLTNTYTSKIGESAKHPDIPHRNLLPNPDELFRYAPQDPDGEARTSSTAEIVKLIRECSPALKPKLPDPAAK